MHGLFTGNCPTQKVKLLFLCSRCEMAQPGVKYILLQDRVGHTVERSVLSLGLTTKSSPMQVLRGELFEGVPEAEQPEESTKVAAVGIERKSLRLECRTEDLARLYGEDANLLLPISSAQKRYDTFMDRNRLPFGRKLFPGSTVFVEVKGVSKDLPGVVWYIGELPPGTGTWFGVELVKNPGSGTCDGTFRNKRYFKCAPDSGVFVALDKLKPRDNTDDLKSQKNRKKDENIQANITSRLKDSIRSFWKGKLEHKSSRGSNGVLKIDDRVVTFIGNIPARGTVRYLGQEKDSSGNDYIDVGLEMDERVGAGTGKKHGFQVFVCETDFAAFVPLETVMPEKDFDENPEQSKRHTPEDESYTRSMSCVNISSDRGASKESLRKLRRTNSLTTAETQLIMAAGESSKTDTLEFIEKQREMLKEFEGKNLPDNQDNDVVMQDEERTDSAGNFDFKDDHFESSPPDKSVHHGKQIITKQPGLSNGDPKIKHYSQAATLEYPDFVHIEKKDYDNLSRKHERDWDSRLPAKHPLQSISHGSPQQKEEARLREQGENGNDPIVSTAEVELEKSSGASAEKMDVEMLPNDPSEQLHTQSQTILPNSEMEANTRNGESGSLAVDNHHGLEVGSMIEVPMANGYPRYGVIRWIGFLPNVKDKLVAGLELEEEQSACSDGTFNKERYFTCQAGRGFFVLLEHCRPDSRFETNTPTSDMSLGDKKDFGTMLTPEVPGVTMPPETLQDKHCGQMRGLQGHHNSCYLDATLYSMFAFTYVFDTLLHRKKRDNDLLEYEKVQTVLRDFIVNPLRTYGFVRADRLLMLRRLLDQLSSTAGLVNEEKDPEEFLNSLLQQVLKADPFLHLKPRDVQEKDSEGAFLYQIITDKDDTVKIAQVQKLLEQSFISADLILSEVPSCLVLQMPRFGKRYKMYDMILPNLELDVTHIVENVPRECSLCGVEVAQYECKKCYQTGLLGAGSSGIASYCKKCNDAVHSHPLRQNHKPWPILLPRVYSQYSDGRKTGERQRTLDKQKMELFAVVCIETSHYVAFVKCGPGAEAPWCFFDSMADRKGERNGYNIPAVTPCPEALEWLSKTPDEISAAKERGEMPEKVRRLLGDGYLCMYQNLEMVMYK
ncbi:ubiquitin carboxyl-terminal hydrolase CYLD-like [Stylophora pistillata]|uniref:ubiquitin carboxyl-terminal hydrolase CYLD-like n=1 Tax=Stylophora pistillata TaxID=50429 RepID=UPI000C043DA9|nr:ubiquitin carboxyl-terminal hydrolase CYLD-like [Stylophora pistillata]